MRKSFTVLLVLCLAVGAFAGSGKKEQKMRIGKKMLNARIVYGDELPGRRTIGAKANNANASSAIGPGKVLMQSTYDYGSNGGVLSNLFDYGDGTLAVGRMGATRPIDPATDDRGTFFSYFDGSVWSPAIKVEQVRRGWSNISALADGRSVTVSHVALEANVDALKGFGIWTSTITGNAAALAATWPRLTVDGSDNIIACSSDGVAPFGKQLHISRDGGATWTNSYLQPDTTDGAPAFGPDDQAIASRGNNVAVAVSERFGDNHLWTSTDNGATWAYRNLTNYPATIPAGTTADYPAGSCDVMYDNNGNLHLFWETFLALPDSAGTGLDFFESTGSGIYHWSEAAGISEVADFDALPNADQEINPFAGNLGAFDQHNIDGNVVCQPQGGVDADNNLYLLFCSFRPNDFDPDSAHYTDIYAAGSNDGGASWGAPVNVTDSPGAEDTWGSLAKNIGDSLRFVYSSDGSTGNSIQGGGVAPTTYLYYAFSKALIPLETAVEDRPSGVPSVYALAQNFPNPFNPSTAITFSLPASVNVTLEVYNMIGQKVATLVNGKLAAGDHTVNWSAQDVPSGIYFYKLEAANFSQTRKMVLMK